MKGREWDRVAVFGVTDGIVPHRLAEDVEEERRVLHVAITRGRHRVAVLADRTRRSPFLAELAGTRPEGRPRPRDAPCRRHGAGRRPHRRKAAAADGIEAAEGLVVTVLGGYEGTIEDDRRPRAPWCGWRRAPRCAVRFGERVELARPQGAARRADRAVGRGRRAPRRCCGRGAPKRSQADGVPAYIVVNDKHLRGIALARPTTPAELVACDGIGPTKLERYGDEILELLTEP